MYQDKVLQRFNKKVQLIPFTDCWAWTGNLVSIGYGQAFYMGKRIYAHRLSYQLFKGPIPKGEGYHGTCVLHKCDNPMCVNPDHLFLGTAKDNMRDKAEKDRTGSAKITNAKAREIRERSKTESLISLAKEYRVHYTSIHKILTNENHIDKNYIPKPLGQTLRRKLTIDQVKEIKKLHRNGTSKHSLTRAYNVGYSTIDRIIQGVTYKEVKTVV